MLVWKSPSGTGTLDGRTANTMDSVSSFAHVAPLPILAIKSHQNETQRPGQTRPPSISGCARLFDVTTLARGSATDSEQHLDRTHVDFSAVSAAARA